MQMGPFVEDSGCLLDQDHLSSMFGISVPREQLEHHLHGPGHFSIFCSRMAFPGTYPPGVAAHVLVVVVASAHALAVVAFAVVDVAFDALAVVPFAGVDALAADPAVLAVLVAVVSGEAGPVSFDTLATLEYRQNHDVNPFQYGY